MTRLFALTLAGTLIIPHSVLAGDARPAGRLMPQSATNELVLPPIPHVETIPWLTAAYGPQHHKLSILLHPSFENLKLLNRDMPQAFSSAARTSDPS